MDTTTIDSPIGPLTLEAEGARLTGIRFGAPRRGHGAGDSPVLRAARTQLGEYFDGVRREFELPLAEAGTAFQRCVWSSLCRIPFGETRSYTELAASAGRPGAMRAAGAANGRNPFAIVVPCHRVIGADGTLTGYAGGLDAKRWLLEHEARVSDASRGLPLASLAEERQAASMRRA